jgi:hypothetical protein
MLQVEMDPRYRVEFICPKCEKEFQITCPDNVERCTCGAELDRISEPNTGHRMRSLSAISGR